MYSPARPKGHTQPQNARLQV